MITTNGEIAVNTNINKLGYGTQDEKDKFLLDKFPHNKSFKSMNDIDKARYLTDHFNIYSKKTAENIIITCFTFYTAAVSNDEIKSNFFKSINFDIEKQASQYKKFNVIGANFWKLLEFIDVLPHKWSTIYRLARVDIEVLEQLKEKKLLTPTMTVKEILNHLTERTLPKPKQKNKEQASKKLKHLEVTFSEAITQDQIDDFCEQLQILQENKEVLTFSISEINVVEAEATEKIISNIDSANDSEMIKVA